MLKSMLLLFPCVPITARSKRRISPLTRGIYFSPLVTNDMSVINNNSSLLMNKVPLLKNNMPLLKNKVPLLQDLTCRFRKVPVERPFKSFYRLQEVTSDLT